MLTFFAYLRQRAFESVLAGAHEALTRLETLRYLEESPTKITPPPQAIEQRVTAPAPAAPPANSPASAAAVTASDTAKEVGGNRQHYGHAGAEQYGGDLPQPRLRGRSKRKGSHR